MKIFLHLIVDGVLIWAGAWWIWNIIDGCLEFREHYRAWKVLKVLKAQYLSLEAQVARLEAPDNHPEDIDAVIEEMRRDGK